jgi:hypothetical protein
MNIDTIRYDVASIEAQSRNLDIWLQRMCRFNNRVPFPIAKTLAQNENINSMVHQHERGVGQTLRREYRVASLFKYHAPCREQDRINSVDEDCVLHTDWPPERVQPPRLGRIPSNTNVFSDLADIHIGVAASSKRNLMECCIMTP